MNRSRLTENDIRLFIKCFVLMMIIVCPIYIVASPEAIDAYEFGAYICPCAAGVLAGAGLFFHLSPPADVSQSCTYALTLRYMCALANAPLPKAGWMVAKLPYFKFRWSLRYFSIPGIDAISDEKKYYANSVLFLFLGLICYVLQHKSCQAPVIGVVASFVAVAALWVLKSKVVNNTEESSMWNILDGISLSIVFPIVIVSVGLLAFFFHYLFVFYRWHGWFPSLMCIG